MCGFVCVACCLSFVSCRLLLCVVLFVVISLFVVSGVCRSLRVVRCLLLFVVLFVVCLVLL